MSLWGFQFPGMIDENPMSLSHLPDRKQRREDEARLRRISETLGDLAGKANDVADSLENVEEATNIPKRIISRAFEGMSVEEARKKLSPGDHIKCNRTVYSHHAIYIGNGYVIEYNDEEVKQSSLGDFADGDQIIRCNDEEALYSPDEIVRRAKSRLGERDYNLICNNCDNFATWCRCGGPI